VDVEKDYYSDLGVLPDVSREVIRAVYLALAKRFHPDSGKEHADPEKFKTINAAYEILYDDVAREKYDKKRAEHTQSSYNRDVDDEEDLVDDELADGWRFAAQYYPEIEELRKEVSAISSTLSVVFQSTILNSKNFGSAASVKTEIIENFVERYFGKNKEVKAFALKLLNMGRRDAAKELNKAVLHFGDELDHKIIIPQIIKKFELNEPHKSGRFPDTFGTSRFLEEHGYYAIYVTEDDKFVIVDIALKRNASSAIYTYIEDARRRCENL